jgi:signal transduction histidine kinase
MQSTDAPAKLLAFPSQLRGGREPVDAANLDGRHPGAFFDADPNQVPHDIAMLRRPTAVETMPAPRINELEGLAHDARNLLTSLELFSGLLAEPGVLGEGHEHFAGDIKSLAIPLAVLVERMAIASQSKGSQTPGHADPVFTREPVRPPLRSRGAAKPAAAPAGVRDAQNDAGVVVKSCERMLAAIAGPAVTLQVSYERGLGELALSGEALTRVLINLVRNASEAMGRGGRIDITVRKGLGAKPSAILSVQDNGVGIPPHALGQIFQAGFSSKKAQNKWPSAVHHGLGLTIVRDLVEEAGGSVRVASTPKKGTTFELKLPCSRI